MRFVTWNMRGATDRKWPALRAWQPDIAVLCEVVEYPTALTQPALTEAAELNWEWEGTNPVKGLAIAGWDVPLRRRPTRDASGRWACGAAFGQTLVIGLWACPRPGGSYAAEIVRALDAFEPQIRRHHQLIVAGDFNVAGHEHSAFQGLRRRLENLGLVSAYHAFTDEPFGLESAKTFHARHANEASQHIDYVWVSAEIAERITSVTVGDTTVSDHSPVIVDWDDPTT